MFVASLAVRCSPITVNSPSGSVGHITGVAFVTRAGGWLLHVDSSALLHTGGPCGANDGLGWGIVHAAVFCMPRNAAVDSLTLTMFHSRRYLHVVACDSGRTYAGSILRAGVLLCEACASRWCADPEQLPQRLPAPYPVIILPLLASHP